MQCGRDVAIVDVVVAMIDVNVAIAKPSVAHITFFVALEPKYVANEESSRSNYQLKAKFSSLSV